MWKCFCAGLVVVPSLVLGSLQAHAQGDPFYKGKTVEVYIGYSVGGAYDVYARMLARHMGKHIPGNPILVPTNMEGAGSLRLANWLYNVAPKDGTIFGIIGRGVPFDPILGGKGAQFDPVKFSWIGSANDEVSICASWHTSGITKFEDLLTREMTVGGVGASSDTDQFPKIVNGVLGTKMRVITGYPGGADVNLAMQRGEVAGRCGWSWSSIKSTNKQWVDERQINLLFQMSLEKHPDLPNLPLVMEFAKNDEQRSILKLMFARQVLGRPFVGPPGVPADRLRSLRDAFNATMKDPEFLADAEKAQLEITPVAGEAIEKLMTEVLSTAPEIAQRAGAMVSTQ
jgi:tripartite-type tricarboxylate transporter receptor subunit TctC